MSIVSPAQNDILDRRFAKGLKSLRTPLDKLGFELYRGTALDVVSYMEVGDASVPVKQLGLIVDASSYRMVSLGAETKYSEPSTNLIAECDYQRMDFWGLTWNRLWAASAKQQVLDGMPELAAKPAVMPMLEILNLLAEGESKTCLYDRKAFFHAAHLIDPTGADVAANQAPNLLTIDLDTAGWNSLLQTIINKPNPGSKASEGKRYLPNRGLNGDTLELWTSETAIFTELAKIFNPTQHWATATATEQRLRFAQATLQMVPEMAATDYFYAIVKTAPMKGVYARMPHRPTVEMTTERSETSVHRKTLFANAYCTFGRSYYYPFAIYKVKLGS